MGRTIVVCLLLVVAVLAVYWPAMGFGFIEFDDPEYVRENLHVTLGLTCENVLWAFKTNWHSNWHPVTWLSWMLEAELHGVFFRLMRRVYHVDVLDMFPRLLHTTNVLLHAANVLLLFGVLRKMTGAFWRSALAAGLFAVHPMHVESVAWISERKDLLCGLFWLLTIWTYVGYVRRGGAMRYLLMLLCFVLGLMSKGMMVTLPAVLLLLDYWPLKRGLGIGSDERPLNSVNPQSAILNSKSLWLLLLEKTPLLLLGVGLSIVTWMIQRPGGKLEEGVWIPMTQRLSNGALAYVRYLGKLIWPFDLAVLYPNPNLIGDAWPAWKLWSAIGVIAIVTLTVCVLRRKRPYLFVGWMWFLGTMLPVIGLVQFGRQSMSDRYAYIPFIGLYIAIAWGLADLTERWPRRNVIMGVMASLILVACAVRASSQVGYWRDSRTLFQHAVDVTDRNWVMHRNLAGVLENQDKADEAFLHMEESLRIFEECAWLHDTFGSMLARHERLPDAQRHLERALELDPGSAQARLNLGVVLSLQKKYDEAMEQVEHARRLDADLAERCDAVLADIRARRGSPTP